ncbi:hypothetical protein D6764_04735 [Candidatus Woesearchaeota archaeon]|nr:MAG: hypothetical protein D6764_04735 [Candidatus Woesearchaeota archaeon]
MWKIFAVILRNIKLLTRSKLSGLIVIAGPLFIMFLVGLAFNTSNIYSINIAAYKHDNSPLSDTFISQLRQNKFSVSVMDSLDECIESVRWGASHICIEFPADFVITNNKTNEINFYADTSQMNIVYLVLDSVSSELSSRASELSEGLTQLILDTVDSAREMITNNTALLTEQGARRKSALAEIDSSESELDGLDLELPSSASSDVDSLSDSIDELSDKVDELSDNADDAVSEFRSLMSKVENNAEDLVDELDDANLSTSDAEAILDFINDSRDSLNRIEENLDNANSNISDQFSAIHSLLSDVSRNIDKASNLLGKASDARSSVKEKFKSIREDINKSEAIAQQILSGYNALASQIDSLPVTSAHSIARPVTTSIKSVSSEQSNLVYMFPALIMLLVMFMPLLLSSTLVIMERKSMATFRNFCTPTKDISFMLGTFITSLLVVGIQLGLLLSIAVFFFKDVLVFNPLVLVLVLVVLTVLFTVLGMAIGYFFSSEETVTLASISVGSLLLLLSDFILPLESMPPEVASLASYNPFVIGTDILRQVVLFDFGFWRIYDRLYILLLYAVALFLLTIIVQKIMKYRFLRLYTRFNVNKKDKKAVSLQLEPSEPLKLDDGSEIKTLGELAEKLESIPTKKYEQYVSEDSDAFADWIRKSYGDASLAAKFARTKSLKKRVRLLRKAQKKRDKLIEKRKRSGGNEEKV